MSTATKRILHLAILFGLAADVTSGAVIPLGKWAWAVSLASTTPQQRALGT
jgi:hypothetical protein